MKVLGVTGGIGMGKSTCAGLLRAHGVRVVDTDDLARELVQPGMPALQEIAAAFGPRVLDEQGALCRSALATLVFESEARRRTLENILHPRIRERWLNTLRIWQGENVSVAAVIIPLLYETGAEKELDAVLCVACSARTQRERLSGRGWSPEHLAQRMAAQLPVQIKVERANYVVWSEGTIELHAAQLKKILTSLCPSPPAP